MADAPATTQLEKPEVPAAVTKYEQMDKSELREEVRRLQKELLVAEAKVRTAGDQYKKAEDAYYKSASDENKPDALVQMLESGVTYGKCQRETVPLAHDLSMAKNAYGKRLQSQ